MHHTGERNRIRHTSVIVSKAYHRNYGVPYSSNIDRRSRSLREWGQLTSASFDIG